MKLNKQNIINSLKSPSSAWQTAALVAVAATGYLYRSSQYLFKPQLFAEDGNVWLAQGHNKSITALAQPVNGFFHVPERLFGYLVAHVSLHYAPLIFVLTAWGLFILLAYYLLSSRTKILTNNYERLFMTASLCLVANMYELFFNFSNSVFLMGIIGVLILLARPPKNRIGIIAERTFFLLSCLTLPFAWFYLPLTLVERFKYKRKEWFFLITSAFASVAQLICYFFNHIERAHITILSMFSKWTLLEIYNQMIIPGIRFARIDILVQDYSLHHYQVFTVFFTVIAMLIATYAVVRKSNKQVWYLLFFLAAMSFASVKGPSLTAKTAVDALKVMSVIVGANRYFVYGVLAVNLIFIKSTYLALAPKARYIFLVLFVAFGLLTSLHYQNFYIEKQFVDYRPQYNKGISDFESGKQKSVTIPVNPTSWYMTLTK
ncbi:MAG TPA: hypothetical protein VLF90_01940 [Patescibacteria group bacterium]|nr:hypothetical protein [Patescibacteria group bacterium]